MILRPSMVFDPVEGPWFVGERVTDHFYARELQCRHCKRLPDTEAFRAFALRLERARILANVPFIITSGFRCVEHNREVGGAPDSSHLVAVAADIECNSMSDRLPIIRGSILAGFHRIGIAKTFIHIDDDYRKPASIWLYVGDQRV
jgi:hypothetical protein